MGTAESCGRYSTAAFPAWPVRKVQDIDQQEYPSEYQIEVAGLWKVFGNRPERALDPAYASRSRTEIQEELDLVIGLRDISFSVRAGEIFVVMGLSGSGKSTLVRCLIRLIESTRGRIVFDGEDILGYTQAHFRRNVDRFPAQR